MQAQWPGASPEEITRQVTDRIEKKLEELEVARLHQERHRCRPNHGLRVPARHAPKPADVPPIWARVRNMIADIKGDFPARRHRTAVSTIALAMCSATSMLSPADGLSPRQLRDQVEDIRAKVLTVPNVGKVDILGAQDEVIYLEFSTRKIAALGLDTRAVMARCRRRMPSRPPACFRRDLSGSACGSAASSPRRKACKAINLRVNDRFFPLTERCHHHTRLCRSADDAGSLQRPARDRSRHRDEDRCQPPGIRRGFEGADVEDRGRPADRRRRSSRGGSAGRRRARRLGIHARRCSKR